MKRMMTAALMVVGFGMAMPGAALAADVFIDGELVERVDPIKVEGCDVRFDQQGNVHITTPSNALVLPSNTTYPAQANAESTASAETAR